VTSNTANRTAWAGRLNEDIATLERNNAKPEALLKRLRELAADNRQSQGVEQGFSSCGRGTTLLTVDERDRPTVTLKFRDRVEAKKVRDQLNDLNNLGHLKTVKDVEYKDLGEDDGVVVLLLTDPDQPAKKAVAKKAAPAKKTTPAKATTAAARTTTARKTAAVRQSV
jgi:hypothetical protein